MTHRDGLSALSVRSQCRRDALHHKMLATRSESSERPPFRSLLGLVGGRQRALPMLWHRLRLASYPTSPRSDPYGSLLSSFGIRFPQRSQSSMRSNRTQPAARHSRPEVLVRGFQCRNLSFTHGPTGTVRQGTNALFQGTPDRLADIDHALIKEFRPRLTGDTAVRLIAEQVSAVGDGDVLRRVQDVTPFVRWWADLKPGLIL